MEEKLFNEEGKLNIDVWKSSALFDYHYKHLKHMKFLVLWDWWDIGFVFKINKQLESSDYYVAVDFQILWFNLWTQIWKRPRRKRNL